LLACCWIERTGEMPPVEFDILLNTEILDAQLKHEINELLDIKKSGGELHKGARILIIDEFIENRFNHFEQYLKDFQFKNEPGYARLNSIFRDTLKDAWK
jgi:predicted nucleotidyltransferase